LEDAIRRLLRWCMLLVARAARVPPKGVGTS